MLLIPILFALLSPEVPVTPPVLGPASSAHGGVVGTSGDRSLVLWMDWRGNGDLYATRIDASGNRLDPPGIVVYHGQAAPAVAPMPSGDFMVALALLTNGETDILHVTRDGAVTARKKIDDIGRVAASTVQIATNGTSFLVLINGQRVLLVDADGNVLAGPFVVGTGSYGNAVASNGRDYLIARVDGPSVEVLPVSANGDIGTPRHPIAGVTPSDVTLASNGTTYFLAADGFTALETAVLQSDGTPIAGPQVTATGLTNRVRATWDGREYALVWSVPTSFQDPTATVFASLFDVAGRALIPTPLGRRMTGDAGLDITTLNGNLFIIHGEQFGLFGTLLHDGNLASASFVADFPIAQTATAQSNPNAVPTPGGAVIVWRETTFRARILDADGHPAGKVVDIGDPGNGNVQTPGVAFDGRNVVFSWIARGILYAQRYTTALDPVDTAPIRIAGDDNVSTSVYSAALAAGGGQSLLAWRPLSENGEGNRGAILTSAGTVVPVALPSVPVAGAAWNGSEFLVAYAVATGAFPSQGLFPDPPCDIAVLRVAPNGALLDAAPHTVAHLDTYVDAIAVASNGSGFLVAWKPDLYQRYGIPSVIAGVNVNANGTADSSAPRALSSAGVYEGPFITPYAGEYAVAWTTAPTYAERVMQWRTTRSDTTESSETVASISYLGGAAVTAIGSRVVLAYPRIDDSPQAGRALRVFLRTVSTAPRRRAALP